jgi:hypothetical protein
MSILLSMLLFALLALHVVLWVRLFRHKAPWQVVLAALVPALVPLWGFDLPGPRNRQLVWAWFGLVALYALLLTAA